MCVKLSELEEAMASFASGFEPGLVSAGEAEGVMERAARIEHMAATVKALAAARVAATELWRLGGDRTPAHMLARRSGEPVSQAAQELENAQRLGAHPKTDAAARKGRLSPQQTAAITDAAEADPGAEDDLLDLAERASLPELRDEAARRKAAVTDLAERHARIRKERCGREWTDAEGAWNFHARGTPEDGATIMATLGVIRDRLFKKARAEGRREPPEAYLFDAFCSLARGSEVATTSPGATKILVRVDFEALLRGRPVHGEVCEIAGFGPVPVSVVEELLAQGDTFLAAVVTKGQAVTGVAHLGRRPTVLQKSALEWLYPTCAVEGCSALARQVDHRIDWSKSHVTVFDCLDPYCKHHHDLKTLEGWMLVEGTGKRAFVPPDDPRHPRNAKQRERPPPEAA
jgi:hypothetical protein